MNGIVNSMRAHIGNRPVFQVVCGALGSGATLLRFLSLSSLSVKVDEHWRWGGGYGWREEPSL